MAVVTDRNGTLLLYAPVPLYSKNEDRFVEAQALNGMRLWAKFFERVIVMMPHWKGAPPQGWISTKDSDHLLDRVELVELPEAYRPDQFFRELSRTKVEITKHIEQADYLSFAIGGLFGDWGLVASSLANKMGRKHAVWTDRVESQVVWRTRNEGNWRKRIMARATYLPMVFFERKAIRRSTMGLFHGRETYETYRRFSENPQIVHDIHCSIEDHVSEETLQKKIEAARSGPLKIIYTGRADEMKGPLDWIEVLLQLNAKNVDFQASWMGDGTYLAQMKELIAAHGLESRIQTPGFVSDRNAVLKEIQDAHLFLFCHKTPESPRCLIEALISGTPIVGYDGVYARDLVSTNGGGEFVEIGRTKELTEVVAGLEADRSTLTNLIQKASLDGAPFDDESVFRHRSELIRKYL